MGLAGTCSTRRSKMTTRHCNSTCAAWTPSSRSTSRTCTRSSSPTSSTRSCRPKRSSGVSTSTSPASAAPAPSSPAPAPTPAKGRSRIFSAATPRTCSAWSGSHLRARSCAPARWARATAGSAAKGPARRCAASAGAPSALAAVWGSIRSAPSSSAPASARKEWQVNGTLPAYRLPLAETQRAYTIAVPSWDAWTDAYYEIYDNEIGYIFHRQFNLAGGDLAAAFWLMYNDSTKTLGDMPELAARPDVQELTEELRISFQLILAGRSEGRHRAAGQDPRRHPREGRRPQGRALLRAGHGRVHQHVPAAARPQAHQLRLGRRLHRQLDAVRHAGLGQGLRAGRPPQASAATPPAASSCSAAATR